MLNLDQDHFQLLNDFKVLTSLKIFINEKCNFLREKISLLKEVDYWSESLKLLLRDYTLLLQEFEALEVPEMHVGKGVGQLYIGAFKFLVNCCEVWLARSLLEDLKYNLLNLDFKEAFFDLVGREFVIFHRQQIGS